jgi:ubiquitin carboxyl-terminal hydrolase 2/21
MNNYDVNKYVDKGLSGLANIGNTCYINSLLQILSHTYELNDFLNLETYKQRLNHKPDSILLIEWDNLRQLLWSQNCIVTPGKFVNTLQKVAHSKKMELFTGFAQNDLPEFLLFIIDCFHTALSRKVEMTIEGNIQTNTDKVAVQCYEMIKKMFSNEYSEIWQMFYGIHVSQIISTDESATQLSSSPEPFCIINLSIPPLNKNPSLLDCFDYYIQGEILEGDNAWFNETTREKQSVYKKIIYWSLPDILIIDIKRFNNKNNKNQLFIEFPLENMDLSKYVIGYKRENYIYDLYGICNHSGTSLGGHYTSFVKNANGKWYHFNDTNVAEVSNLSYLISPKAYCLFYRKK